MTRFGGIFRKGPKQDKREPEARRQVQRRVVEREEPRESAISDALDEIEAEDMEEIENLEDELIQLETEEGRIPAPMESSQLEMLLKKLNDIDSKLNHFDSTVGSVKDESDQFRRKIELIEEELKKFPSICEILSDRFGQNVEAREERQEIVMPRVPSKMSVSDDDLSSVIDFDDMPSFQPFGSKIEAPERARPMVKVTDKYESPLESKLSAISLEDIRSPAKEPEKSLSLEEEFVPLSSQDKGGVIPGIKKPILTKIAHDYLTLTMVIRWIEFLFERTKRDRLSLVLDYYVDIGWISEDVKSEIMSIARGEMQDVTKYIAQEEAKDIVPGEEIGPEYTYKKVEDWRLSADDHLKSLLFIMKIANIDVDRDKLNSLEHMIAKFKEDLASFHGV
ncbi:MAG: hypothetical protein OEV21_05470 [Thermoplasmata archaeon]|nr:hypothetical protein [Thermoplasmata archaeon]